LAAFCAWQVHDRGLLDWFRSVVRRWTSGPFQGSHHASRSRSRSWRRPSSGTGFQHAAWLSEPHGRDAATMLRRGRGPVEAGFLTQVGLSPRSGCPSRQWHRNDSVASKVMPLPAQRSHLLSARSAWSVVLPEPEGPSRAITSPAFTLVDGKQCVDPGVALAIVLGDTGHILRAGEFCWDVTTAARHRKPCQRVHMFRRTCVNAAISIGGHLVGTRTCCAGTRLAQLSVVTARHCFDAARATVAAGGRICGRRHGEQGK
jgi:hypothetical protein